MLNGSILDTPVDTRARVKEHNIPLNDGLPEDGADEQILGSDDITEGNISVLSNLQPNPNFRSESYLPPKDRWRTPDFVFFQHMLRKDGKGTYAIDSTPICIVEVKPFPAVEPGQVVPDSRAEAARIIRRTCDQLSTQLDCLYSEFKTLKDVFAFIFVGHYFAFFTAKGRVSAVDCGDRLPFSLFGEKDFSEDFQRCWQKMMDAKGIQVRRGFIRS